MDEPRIQSTCSRNAKSVCMGRGVNDRLVAAAMRETTLVETLGCAWAKAYPTVVGHAHEEDAGRVGGGKVGDLARGVVDAKPVAW